jgi:hypothetical protein
MCGCLVWCLGLSLAIGAISSGNWLLGIGIFLAFNLMAGAVSGQRPD